MQKGMVRANGIFTVWDDGVDTVFGMTLGGSIGVLDDLELGINNYRIGSSLQQRYEGLIPVIFSPSAGFGNMPLYGRYRFVHREKLDFAGDLIFVLPVDTAFALEVALPFRIKPNDRLSVDTGLKCAGPLVQPSAPIFAFQQSSTTTSLTAPSSAGRPACSS